MSLQLYLSNVGKCLSVNLDAIPSPESLRLWIEQSAGIPSDRQILMTVKGKNVKQQHLLSEGQVFVYDKAFLTGSSQDTTIDRHVPRVSKPREFPSTLEDEESIKAWQELFAARRAWALEVVDIVRKGVGIVDEVADECEVFEKCTQVALENLQNHFVSLQQTSDKTQSWANDTLAEHHEVLEDWQKNAEILSELPVREEIANLLSLPDAGSSSEAAGTMLAMLSMRDLEAASASLEAASENFSANSKEVHESMSQLKSEVDRVAKLGTTEWPALHTEALVQEVEAVATKISRDYEDVLKGADNPKSLSQISRSAARHTQELLPALSDTADDVIRMIEEGAKYRETLARNIREALKQVSSIQSKLAGMQTQISALKVSDQGQSSLEVLDRTFRLPIAYGSILIEAIRRSEWNEKMRNDLESLREEISQQKDDEVRRRRKWAASWTGFLDETTVAADNLIDLGFSTPSNKWPFVSRQEIFAYIDDLRALGVNDAVEQVTQMAKELDSVSRNRKPRSKTFKNGSVFDLSQSLLRNGDEVRFLQDDKLRLEDKVRASESRIRKLEDLLHRQSQLSRPSSGIFSPQTDFERQVSSPAPSFIRPAETQSRRPSVSLRRLSNQNLDDKAMVQRIVALEAQITKLQEEAHAERRSSTESRDKMQEAESVKRDLMANFEAQRSEFDDERQLLDDENHKLKIRLEEAEDELDRVLGSRDHQRSLQDQTITALRNDLNRLRKDADEEIDQLKKTKERLQNDLVNQRERVTTLERHVQNYKEEKSAIQLHKMEIANELRSIEEKQQEYVGALQAAHSHLSPSGTPPETLDRLTRALEVLTEGSAIHVRGLDDSLQRVTAENIAQESKILSLESQLENANTQLEHSRKEVRETQEEVSKERSKLTAIRSELADEQTELQKLRDKFAAGETGSDALRVRVEQEEKRVAELMEAGGQKDVQLLGLKHEVEALLQKAKEVNTVEQDLRKHLNARGKKAKELSERLFQHNDRLVRMIESFGYLITHHNDTLVLQRASKVSASLTLNIEGSALMRRTVSGSMSGHHFSEPADLESLYWISDTGQEAEDSKYEAFARAMSRIDLDSTMDTITKRYKDVEALAKKYQRDLRAHKDRCHRLQSEAYDKIAYRSFKEGDLALFLPTRNQATKPWAAFNVGAPHYFLREQDAHKLQARDWLLARITKVEERVVDLSRSLTTTRDRSSINAEGSDGGSLRSLDDENPFELSDGLRWYMIDAAEERPGAPSTPGLGKSTAAASVVEVKGHMSRRATSGRETSDGNAVTVAKTLSKSLDSRRSSDTSRKSGSVAALRAQGSGNSGVQAAAIAAAGNGAITGAGTDGAAEGRMSTPSVRPSDEDVQRGLQGTARDDAGVFDVVRKDLLLGP